MVNKFIETFYDPTEVGEKDTKAATDDIIKEIPSQIKSFLSSKYDYETFEGLSLHAKVELNSNENIGLKREYLVSKLKSVFDGVTQYFTTFFTNPVLNERRFLITANINLDNRRAPLIIELIKGEVFDEILFSIQSIICRNTELRSRRDRDEIKLFLNDKSLNLLENNDFLLVQKKMSLETEMNELMLVLNNVIQIADNLEEEYIGSDLEI